MKKPRSFQTEQGLCQCDFYFSEIAFCFISSDSAEVLMLADNPSTSSWKQKTGHCFLTSSSTCVTLSAFRASDATVTGTGLSSGGPAAERVAAVVTLAPSLPVSCSSLPLPSVVRGGRGGWTVPRPPPTGHLMVIQPGPLMLNPGVNAEPISSGAPQMTTSSRLHRFKPKLKCKTTCERNRLCAFSFAFFKDLCFLLVASHL